MDEKYSILESISNIALQFFGVIGAFIAFWTMFVKNLVSKQEVCDMIKTQSPYAQDRTFIMERLNDNKETMATLFEALNKNTEVMTELKVQISVLSKTLETLENRIERR